MNSPKEDVYATLILNDLYLPGALVLAHSLRDGGTKKKLAVLVTPESVSNYALKELREIFDYVIQVERIKNEFPANLHLMNRPDLHSTFTKILLWKQYQFRKIVYLDSDMVALRAPDELFDLPYPFSAAPDIGWPDIFNSGLMVLSPNEDDYNALLSMAQTGTSFDGADQGLLNMHFTNSFNRLSFIYNVTPSAHYQYVPAYQYFRSKIVMLHFIGQNKPWLQGRYRNSDSIPIDEMSNLWWSIYDRHYKNITKTGECLDSESDKVLCVQENFQSISENKSEDTSFTSCTAQPCQPNIRDESEMKSGGKIGTFSNEQSINQSANPSENQSANQSINQLDNQSANPSENQSANQSINQLENQSANQSAIQSANQSAHQSANQSANQSAHQSINQLENQSAEHPFHQSINQSVNQMGYQSANPLENQSANHSINQFDNRLENQWTEPACETFDEVTSINQSLNHPDDNHEQEEKFSAWDASKEPPPADSKPEAINLPKTQYTMSSDPNLFEAPDRYPDPPSNMWFEVPKAPTYQKLTPIFPWEINAQKPSRIFAKENDDIFNFQVESKKNKNFGEEYKNNEPMTGKKTAASSEPLGGYNWDSFSRVNAWDDVPEINQYIGKLQYQSQRQIIGVQNKIDVSLRAGSSNFSKFSTNAERQVLPVTPTPLRSSKFWSNDKYFSQSPDAEGVPSQEEWDPKAALEHLAYHQLKVMTQDLEKASDPAPEIL